MAITLSLSFVLFFAIEPVQGAQAKQPLRWQPRAASITVEQVSASGADAGRKPTRIRGRIEDGWNYASTNHLPMTGGRLYCLSARVRVDRLGRGTPSPYLKCEFVGGSSRESLGQAHTDAYDSPLGTWQTLVGEFRAPEGTRSCWLAVEKGMDRPAEIDLVLDAVSLEEIPRLTALERFCLQPIPAPLEKQRGVHPRIYLTSDRIAELRQAIQGTHADLWKRVQAQADRGVKHGPPAYTEHDSYSGDEQLWQREVGNMMPNLAIAYRLTRRKEYLTSAQQWALASCRYKTWGLGRIDGMDLAAGHQLFGLALVYDWCFDDIEPAVRQEIRQTLVRRTAAMYEAAATGKIWWARSYLQNHLWVNICGMAASGFALFDEVGEASCWIGLPLEKFRRTMDSLGPDGASHEGVGYWEYGVEYMLKFMDPARDLLGVDLYDRPWWQNTSAYALHLSLPRRAWQRENCIVDIADCPRCHWYGPEYLLRGLARHFRDGHAQWLAAEIDTAQVAAAGAPWLNLLWHDPSVAVQPPTALPTLRHFEDMGIVAARSDWSGDESLAVFKCGPFIGHEAMQRFSYDPGGGHVHPDANHFVLFGNGQWLIRDDGYQPKWTGQHNTLLVNGKGQLGEGAQWFRGGEALASKARPKVLRASSSAQYDYIVGDATAAYPAELGLVRFVRHLIFVKPNVLIVADDIQTQRESELEIRFHTEEATVAEGAAFLARGKRAVLRVEPLATAARATAENTPLPGTHGAKQSGMPVMRLTMRGAEWQNAVALTWSAAGVEPPRVSLKKDQHRWCFAVGDSTVVLDWLAPPSRTR